MATPMTQARTASFAFQNTVRGTARAGWAALAAMVRARQTRRMLSGMDDRMLADIGVSRGEAMSEAARPAWDTTGRNR